VQVKQEHTVYLSLGSNVEPRLQFLEEAIELIRLRYESISDMRISPIYETEPWGFESVTRFLNMCVEVKTFQSPFELLEINQEIEKQLGRTPKVGEGYASREMDIDILFFGDEIIFTDTLTIPHPHLEKRKFVLIPLSDLSLSVLHPLLNKSIQQLLADCSDTSRPNRYKKK